MLRMVDQHIIGDILCAIQQRVLYDRVHAMNLVHIDSFPGRDARLARHSYDALVAHKRLNRPPKFVVCIVEREHAGIQPVVHVCFLWWRPVNLME